MKGDLQKLLSKADADKFTIYAESISKDDTVDASTTADSSLVIHLFLFFSQTNFLIILKLL